MANQPTNYRVTGKRLGMLFHTSSGMARNGAITPAQRAELAASGYRLEPCEGVPVPKPSAQDLAEMAAANRMLGMDVGDDGQTRLAREIAKGMGEILAPLKKSTYRDQT